MNAELNILLKHEELLKIINDKSIDPSLYRVRYKFFVTHNKWLIFNIKSELDGRVYKTHKEFKKHIRKHSE